MIGVIHLLSSLVACVCYCVYLANALTIVSSTLTPEESIAVLDKHNEFRRKVWPPASNMRLLSWSDDLAARAQQYANECVFKHSRKTRLAPFGWITENIYIDNQRSNVFTKEDVIRPVIAWYNESKYYDFGNNTCQNRRICGHYRQTVWDETYKVGCGRARCNNSITHRQRVYKNSVLVVCKYGPAGNIVRLFQKTPRRPYKQGIWCSDCPEEAPVCVNKLCGANGTMYAQGEPIYTDYTIGSSTSTSTEAILRSGWRPRRNFTVKVPDNQNVVKQDSQIYTDNTIDSSTSTEVILKSGWRPGRSSTVEMTDNKNVVKQDSPPTYDDAAFQWYLCSSKIGSCLAGNQTMTCTNLPETISNQWSCARYTNTDLMKVDCVDSGTALQRKGIEDLQCCNTEFCNSARHLNFRFSLLGLVIASVLLMNNLVS